MAGPDVELPAEDSALELLLRTSRRGPPYPWESTPWDFVQRWPDASVRERAWPIISRLLTDEDELVRARAVEFVRVWSEGVALTTPRLLEVAEQHADLFADQQVEGVSLRSELAFALSNRAHAGEGMRIAALLREMATHEPIGGGAASVLGRYHPTFVAAQALKWGDAQADWIEAAARSLALFHRDAVLPFLKALRELGQPTRERVLAAVEEYIRRDDATASTLARGEGLPLPTQPAPSVEDCKSAIGL